MVHMHFIFYLHVLKFIDFIEIRQLCNRYKLGGVTTNKFFEWGVWHDGVGCVLHIVL